jgi:hypothetical protein
MPGWPGPLVAAAHQHLIEAVQPAEAAAALQFDESRIDNFLHGRVPAEGHVSAVDLEYAHAAGRDDGDRHHAVVDLDQLDTFLFAAVQDALADRESRFRGDAEIGTGDRPVLLPAARP